MDQKKTIRPFSMKDKIGYTLGDLGCCFTEQYRAMYLSIFYTLILQVCDLHRHQRYLLSGRFRHAGADLGYGQRRHRLP